MMKLFDSYVCEHTSDSQLLRLVLQAYESDSVVAVREQLRKMLADYGFAVGSVEVIKDAEDHEVIIING